MTPEYATFLLHRVYQCPLPSTIRLITRYILALLIRTRTTCFNSMSALKLMKMFTHCGHDNDCSLEEGAQSIAYSVGW